MKIVRTTLAAVAAIMIDASVKVETAKKGRIGTWLRWGVSIALLALLFRRFDFTTILHVCLRATPGFFLGALLLYVASQVLSALRWQNLARGIGFEVRFVECLEFYAIGMFLMDSIGGWILQVFGYAGEKREGNCA